MAPETSISRDGPGRNGKPRAIGREYSGKRDKDMVSEVGSVSPLRRPDHSIQECPAMNPQRNEPRPTGQTDRRTLLKASTGVLALGAVATAEGAFSSVEQTAVKNGRTKQSIVHW